MNLERANRWYDLTQTPEWQQLYQSRNVRLLRETVKQFSDSYGELSEKEAAYVKIKSQLPQVKDQTERQKLVGQLTAMEMSPTEQFMAGVGGAVTGTGHRLQELGIAPRTTPQEDIDQQAEMRAGLRETRGGFWGDVMGQAVEGLALPSTRGAGVFTRVAQQMAQNVGLEFLYKPAPSEDSPALRYSIAAAAPAVLEVASSLGVKAASAAAGVRGPNPEAEAFEQLAAKHNISQYGYIDMPGNQGGRWVTNRVSRLPFIGDRMRASRLSDELDLATTNLANNYFGPDFQIQPALLQHVDDTFKPRMQAISDSLRGVYRDRMQVQSHKFEEVQKLLKKYKINDRVEMTNFQPKLSQFLLENDMLLFDQRIPTTMRNQLLELADLTIDETTQKVIRKGKTVEEAVKEPGRLLFGEVQNLNRALNDIYGKIMADPKYKGLEGQIRAMKATMWADLDNWSEQGIKASQKGEVKAAWESARQWHKDKIAPIDDEGSGYLYRVIKGDLDLDMVIKGYLQGSKYSRPELLMESLPLKGQNMVRGQFITDAYLYSMQNGMFSPKAFGKYLDKHRVLVNELFTKDQANELIGLKQIMTFMDDSLDVLKIGRAHV